jgi:nicotinamide mononucleotide transporter
MSFVAMYLTTMRKNEGWIYWIIFNVISIWLYWIKDVKLISIQYVFFLGMAIYGLANWIRENIRRQLPPSIAVRQ